MRAGRVLITGALSLTTAFAGLAALADTAVAAPTTRYVATTGADGENDCTTQATPCKTIQHAVDVAASGDTIRIADGTYAESVGVQAKILSFVGESRDTLVTGDGDGPAFNLAGGGETPIAVSLAHLSVQRVRQAPGITAVNVNLTIDDGYVIDNGLGLLNAGGSLVVTDSVFSDNGSGEGGDEGLQGGGIFSASTGVTTILRSTVSGNAGPGLVAFGNFGDDEDDDAPTPPKVLVTKSSISNNLITGVVVGGAELTVNDSTLDANRAAGIIAGESTVAVQSSTVSDTRTTDIDGFPTDEQAGIVTALPDEPTSDRVAAAPALRRAAATLPRTSPLRKALAAAAPARRLAATGVTVRGSILDNGAVPDCSGDVVDGGHNLSSDATNSCGFTVARKSLSRTDPELGQFGLNGGPTETRVPASDSAAVDAIPLGSAGCAKGTSDQRGVSRPQGARCDIGAVEVKASAVPVKITTKSLPEGQVGDEYRKTLAATGGDGDYTWTLGKGSSLPDGLGLSRAGVITGTPTEAGTFSVTVVADGTSRRYTLVIAEAAGTNGNGADPIAETGAPSASLTALGSALLLAGLFVLMAAGHVGRRPGRHRNA